MVRQWVLKFSLAVLNRDLAEAILTAKNIENKIFQYSVMTLYLSM